MNGMKLACDMLEMPVTLVDTKEQQVIKNIL